VAYQTGLAHLRVEGTTRDLEGFVWYATEDDTAPAEHHSNAVWQGIEAIADARPAAGAFPLVVLSHGMSGNAMSQSWLAADLARQGFVVAAANHRGTSTWSRDPDDSRQLWERPKDISRTTTPCSPRTGSARMSIPAASTWQGIPSAGRRPSRPQALRRWTGRS
jgi:predicted dienelactone hydrolase